VDELLAWLEAYKRVVTPYFPAGQHAKAKAELEALRDEIETLRRKEPKK
jgi:hypothetical protein